mmetsp:Transcript_9568/g.29692  ORF Transcript_9568/g.29692 Transcript_9568/m.29692 type:complete len:528 (+) Transcript_9568:123-1706(+)
MGAACSSAPETPVEQVTAQLHESVLTTIGNTPLIKLSDRTVTTKGVNVYVKCEQFNPMSSVKDRLAIGVIEWAEKNGELKPGQTVVEASSGNTGIGLAMVCAAKGYPFVCVMSESFSVERRKLMRFLGAKVILTNPAHKGSGMVIKAKELADHHGWFRPRQFENEANAAIHETTTGPEILAAMGDRPITYFVCAYGTGGTLKGVGKALRAKSPATKIVACEPDNAPLLYSEVKTEYGGKHESFVTPHPCWRPHLFQGWAPDFIPELVSKAQDEGLVDEIQHVGGDEAMATAKALAANEGLFSGTSGGGTLAVALRLAQKAGEGSDVNIVCLLADTGERYLSTPLFKDIPADMTEEEKALAGSPPAAEAPPAIELPEVDDASPAMAFVKTTNKDNKLVVWSLQYCEFCWTLFGLLDALGLQGRYKVINIDSFEYAKENTGNKYRSAVSKMTGVNTFPQLFIEGEFYGGAVDAAMGWKKGTLQPKLEKAGLNVKKVEADGSKGADFNGYAGDPFEFLPKWMTQNPLRSK